MLQKVKQDGGALQCAFNLSRGAVWCAGTAPPDAALAGSVQLRGASGATRPAGELREGAGAWSNGVALSGEASTPARIEMRGSRLSPELITPAIFHSTGVSFTWRAHTWCGLG